ncbi:MAG TPA: peptide chain release factor 2 [Armatimonadota bacterium]|nr:peptide chain release factor 2 [Armatimonadota bacterium]HPP73507.1 peptide chain release factor 2 [Armatimonadota bacterium]
MLVDIKREIDDLTNELEELGGHLDLAGRQAEIDKLEQKTLEPGFWDDPQEAQKLLQELNQLKNSLEPIHELRSRLEDLKVLAELSEEEGSEEYTREMERELQQARQQFEQLELSTLLGGEHDSASAIVEINAGAGGTEACDWADMLLRMYLRWAERHGYRTEVIDTVPGEMAGSKKVTFLVEGTNAYGYLKAERGVHRLVRISPFDANKRRHTSFASVDVIPDVEGTEEVQISPDEIKIDTFRASSAGGQHVNKTDSAVRITHIPTGIVVSCQNERSQHRNKEVALKVLQARLLEMQRAEDEARIAELRGDVRAIQWGNQIRSYVFQPYTMVKDHRTGHETGDVVRVMDGDIDDFIRAYLTAPQQ